MSWEDILRDTVYILTIIGAVYGGVRSLIKVFFNKLSTLVTNQIYPVKKSIDELSENMKQQSTAWQDTIKEVGEHEIKIKNIEAWRREVKANQK